MVIEQGAGRVFVAVSGPKQRVSVLRRQPWEPSRQR